MAVLESGLENGVLPVRSLTQDAGVGEGGIGFGLTLVDEVVVECCKSAEVEHVETLGLTVDGEHAVVAEFGITRPAVLGGDEDHTVGTLGTVDGCSRSILEDFHAQNVGGVDGREWRYGAYGTVSEGVAESEVGTALSADGLYDDTVDDIERFSLGVDGGGTADAGAGARGTGSLYGRHTGCATLQRLVERGDNGTLEVGLLQRGGSAGDVAALHRTVTDNNGLAQSIGVFFQRHFQI